MEFLLPKIIVVLSPTLFWAAAARRRPFPSAIEEVTKE
jgi:hypothetical protein